MPPRDSMTPLDIFVALSKCLSGLDADLVVDDPQYFELANRIIETMNVQLDTLCPAKPVATENGTVTKASWSAEKLAKSLGSDLDTTSTPEPRNQEHEITEILVLRDSVLQLCQVVTMTFRRGSSFAEWPIPPSCLILLRNKADALEKAVDRYRRLQKHLDQGASSALD